MISSPIFHRSGQKSATTTIFLGWHSPYTSQPKNIVQDSCKFEKAFGDELADFFAELLPNSVKSESAGKPIFDGFKVAAQEKKAEVTAKEEKPIEAAPVHIAEDGSLWHYGFQSKTKAGMYRHLISESRTHAFFTQDGKPNTKVAIIPKKYRQ
jgi:hypothetical protein